VLANVLEREGTLDLPDLYIDVSECRLYKLAYGMHFSGSKDEVFCFFLLEDPPHSLDIITSWKVTYLDRRSVPKNRKFTLTMPPISLRVNIAQIQATLLP
jgi:hypothetical protein